MICYGPADATATSSSLASLKFRIVYLSGAGLPRLFRKKRPLNVLVRIFRCQFNMVVTVLGISAELLCQSQLVLGCICRWTNHLCMQPSTRANSACVG